ncbi:ribonuclease R [Cytophagaceae bacterium ABcell3]|nr:ribonuclease R [Cytophagaceae bacterium ABcell3]
MSKKKTHQNDPEALEFFKQKAASLFKSSKSKPLSQKQISKKLNIRNPADKDLLNYALTQLEKEGVLERHKDGTWKKPAGTKTIVGKVDFVNARFGYILNEENDSGDIWVSGSRMKNALDGDTVRARIYEGDPRKGRKLEGEVIEVLERGRDTFVGTIEFSPRFAFVIPDSRKMHQDIFIPLEKVKDAKDGEKVIVKLAEWPSKDRSPVGEVVTVLGEAGSNDVEMHAIMVEFGLPYEFPEKVLKAADKISEEISEEEISKRKDMRGITTFTIDPHDAKDFDDALSVRKLDNGNWEVGIHIADVTHYVKPNTLLEREAYRRATSVYLVDRVVPMLPEKLSNKLCSLRPHEDKLTFSAVFELDENANVKNQWFGKTVTHSDRRFAYEEVQEIIETGEGDYSEEIKVLNELAHKLRADRFKKGSIAFETVEVKFRLDENGKPLEVVPKIRKDAHKLIEDFMLLANRKVAEFVYFMKKGKVKNTFVYRIHDHPNPDKLTAFAVFAGKFGHVLNLKDANVADELNTLVTELEGKPEQNVLQSLAIRTMAKATYSTEPEIHFGLAYKHYTHFTSPIRRYPDMMVHRLLEHYLNGGKTVNKILYQEKCEHASEMEKMAADAERASIKYKQVEFMNSMEEGKIYEGIISGVIEHGIFVEMVETKCEGFVRISEIEDDYYEADLDNYRLIGKKNKRMFTLGDKVNVTIKRTDLGRRTIDLLLA